MHTHEGPQGWIPVRFAKLPPTHAPSSSPLRLPVVIFLHPTGSDLNHHADWQASFARRGYLAASVDMRYHGSRVDPTLAYQASLVRAWQENAHAPALTNEHPFLLDNVWDLMRLIDYLQTRDDVDCGRIGATGMSLGGMHSWLLAAADPRVTAAAPVAGFQYFRHAIETSQYRARVESIPFVFAAAARELRGSEHRIDGGVVEAVWRKLLPGVLESYDAPFSLEAIAPRPFLIVTGAKDPRCPVDGVRLAVEKGRAAYAACGAEGQLELFVDEEAGHELTLAMVERINAWMDAQMLKAHAVPAEI